MAPSEVESNGTKGNSREDLTKRKLPEMKLSTGNSPLTAPPPNFPSSLIPQQRALERFKIPGNVIVTGGAGALGSATAEAVLEHGARGLAIFDINEKEGEAKRRELEEKFPDAKILFKKVDATKAGTVEQAVSETAEELGTIDVLLCFAGIPFCAHALDTTLEQFKLVIDINLTGTWICGRAVAEQMKKQGTGGKIVLTASYSGHRVNYPQPQAAYNASKAAVLSLMQSWAAEFTALGIRVNSVSPGYMDTILNEVGDGLEDARKIWNERNPFGRMGTREELVGTYIFLASDAGSYVNVGADVKVDGGQSLF
ncbi:hypothetical protein B0O99DRAFT_513494 [Bisporella sp. PMI_857]|nr:hypothetical protein B0O99DRAFT_513494 [Bisporella sp. PMI_857]